MEGYISDVDATIVKRILEAGGEIVGKTSCDGMCFAGSGHTSSTGRVPNPYDNGRLAGGSSCGSAVAVVVGDCDMTIGGDQGGSIRIPCAWSGASGLKPTYGLVPYTGIWSLEPSFDHAGPMARSVREVAVLLDVIAGPDGIDPRQLPRISQPNYLTSLTTRLEDVRVGLLSEGFNWEGFSEPDVDETVTASVMNLPKLGAQVRDVSVPLHRQARYIWSSINYEGALAVLFEGEGIGRGLQGLYPVSLLEFYGHARRTRGAQLPTMLKLAALVGQVLADRYYGTYYARAQNLRRVLTAAYDRALEEVDVLALPTTPMKASLHNGAESLSEYIALASRNHVNTCPFNLTGHPALSVPCGLSNSLPVGLMIVGRRHEDAFVLRVGHAFQAAFAEQFTRPVRVV